MKFQDCAVLELTASFTQRVCDTAFQIESCVTRHFKTVFTQVHIHAYTIAQVEKFAQV